MKLSLRWKTITTLMALVIAAFVVGFVICTVFSSAYYVKVTENGMEYIYDQMQTSIETPDGYRPLTQICEQHNISLLVKEPSGETVFSYGNASIMSKRLDDLVFGNQFHDGIIKQSSNYTIQKVTDSKNKLLYIEAWGFNNRGDSFIARSAFSGIQNSIAASMKFFSVVCGTLLIIASIIIYFLISYYAEPIRRLAVISQRINEGEFDLKYVYKHIRQDEIGAIGANISEISSKLEKNIAELKTTNLKLENELKKKTELEEARKKYMSDVSHELKTPIAIIEGYAEGLKEGISSNPEDRDYYCDVIIDESQKMNTIIKRLSTLNQLEDGVSAVNLERFNVIEVINGFLKSMQVIIDEKEANIYFDSKKSAYVWSDEFLFEEVLVNYFNNALNHMDENKNIAIDVDKKDSGIICVTVYNSGQLIPEAEMDKLWDKFYKVDKARTREYGGSGLGLSIVKAVADSLGQECGVYNLSDGVAFWINLESAEAIRSDNENIENVSSKNEKPLKNKLKNLPIWKSTVNKAKEIKDDAATKISETVHKGKRNNASNKQ